MNLTENANPAEFVVAPVKITVSSTDTPAPVTIPTIIPTRVTITHQQVNATPTLIHPVIAVAAVGGYPRNRAPIPINLTLSKFCLTFRFETSLLAPMAHEPVTYLKRIDN